MANLFIGAHLMRRTPEGERLPPQVKVERTGTLEPAGAA